MENDKKYNMMMKNKKSLIVVSRRRSDVKEKRRDARSTGEPTHMTRPQRNNHPLQGPLATHDRKV